MRIHRVTIHFVLYSSLCRCSQSNNLCNYFDQGCQIKLYNGSYWHRIGLIKFSFHAAHRARMCSKLIFKIPIFINLVPIWPRLHSKSDTPDVDPTGRQYTDGHQWPLVCHRHSAPPPGDQSSRAGGSPASQQPTPTSLVTGGRRLEPGSQYWRFGGDLLTAGPGQLEVLHRHAGHECPAPSHQHVTDKLMDKVIYNYVIKYIKLFIKLIYKIIN